MTNSILIDKTTHYRFRLLFMKDNKERKLISKETGVYDFAFQT